MKGEKHWEKFFAKVARTIDGFRQPDFVVISPGVEAIVFESFGHGFSVIFVV